MLKTKHLILIFLPALLIGFVAIFIRIVQYQPLFPKIDEQIGEFKIPIFEDDIVAGNSKSPITIVLFEDFNCSACREQNYLIDKLLEKKSKTIKIVWKNLPISQFPYPSEMSHKYSYCANQQNKFLEFKNLAFSYADNLSENTLNQISKQIELNDKTLKKCLESEEVKNNLEKNIQLGLMLNIQAVPTIFLNNKQIQTPRDLNSWEEILKN